MLILGIETSCDDTAAAILRIKDGRFETLSSVVSSQIKLHAKWGGVVPNLAAREHLKNILPVIKEALALAKTSPEKIDLIAVTQGPGLIPALLIGVSTAKTLAYVWKKPLLGIHHIEGHIFANFLSTQHATRNMQPLKKSDFPILCLVVSGGHTQLVLMRDYFDYEIAGETLDDAAGEAFDKTARILGLPYPGGPIIARKAQAVGSIQAMPANRQVLSETLPRPMINSRSLNFSFSGLKTAVLYLIKRNEKLLKNEIFIQEVCHEFQQAVIDVLVSKTLSAAKKYEVKTVLLAGGVSANKELRKQLGLAIKKDSPDTLYLMPDTCYSVDNAAMIAAVAHFRWEKMSAAKRKKLYDNWRSLQADAGLKLQGL